MPQLWIAAEDYAYIRAAVKKASPKEVGGLGVVVIEDGRAIIRHQRLLEQTISASEVDWGDLGEAHAEYLTWLYTPVEDGGAGFDGERYGIYSWHSHGTMGVFWSATDENFIEGVGSSVPWVFSSVFNVRNESKHRLDVFAKSNDLGCELLDNEKPTQISWKSDGACHLFIEYDEETNNLVDELEKLEEAKDASIEKMKEVLEQAIKDEEENFKAKTKAMRERLAESGKTTNEVADALMKHDYDKYVKNSYVVYHPKAHTNQPMGQRWNRNGTNGTNTQQAAGDSDSKGKDQGVGSETEKELNDADLRIALNRFYRGYDTKKKVHSAFKLTEVALCEDIVLHSEVHTQVLQALPGEVALAIAVRPTYQEWVSEVRGMIDHSLASE